MKRKGAKPNCVQAFVVAHKNKSKELHVETQRRNSMQKQNGQRSERNSSRRQMMTFGPDATKPFVIVGLGNPGSKYENTRHNIGFKATDKLAESLGVSLEKNRKLHARIGHVKVEGKSVYLVEPQTFMNQSGRYVFDILK